MQSRPTQVSTLRPLVWPRLNYVVRVLGGEVLQHLPQPLPVRPAGSLLQDLRHVRRDGSAVCVSLSDVRHDWVL